MKSLTLTGLLFSATCLYAQALSIANDPFQYSGQYTDQESGEQYLNARYYDSSLMRFLQRDTYNLANRYSYANGNPITNQDPSGHVILPLPDLALQLFVDIPFFAEEPEAFLLIPSPERRVIEQPIVNHMVEQPLTRTEDLVNGFRPLQPLDMAEDLLDDVRPEKPVAMTENMLNERHVHLPEERMNVWQAGDMLHHQGYDLIPTVPVNHPSAAGHHDINSSGQIFEHLPEDPTNFEQAQGILPHDTDYGAFTLPQ